VLFREQIAAWKRTAKIGASAYARMYVRLCAFVCVRAHVRADQELYSQEGRIHV
jgi:hypothetical protein